MDSVRRRRPWGNGFWSRGDYERDASTSPDRRRSADEEQVDPGSDPDESEKQGKDDGVAGDAAGNPRSGSELADGANVVGDCGEVDDDPEGDQSDAGVDGGAGMARRGMLVGLEFAQEEPEAGQGEANAHQPEAGADPGKEGALGREVGARVFDGAGGTSYRSTGQGEKNSFTGRQKAGGQEPNLCYLLRQPPMQFALLLLLFLEPWPQPRPPALARASATDDFAPLRQQWAQDLRAKKIDDALALYSPDATFVNPDGSRAHGPGPIRQLFQWAAQTFDSNLTFHPDRVEASGMLAVDSGTYQETLVTRATGKQQVLSGSYVMVYRREGGVWKILEQEWTSRQPQ